MLRRLLPNWPAPQRLAGVVFVLALGAALFGAACGGGSADGDATPATVAYRGASVEPPFEKPDALLIDQRGQPFDLRAETAGTLTLLYIGYTHCPDICPTQMYDLAVVMSQLDPAVAEHIRVVMISADPERDTPERLARWLGLFDPRFIGLTGTQAQIDAVLAQLHMHPGARTDLGGGHYAVSHAAYVIAFERDDAGRLVYPLGMTQDDIKHDLERLVQKGWPLS